jgi:hypothetical protein
MRAQGELVKVIRTLRPVIVSGPAVFRIAILSR